MAANTRLDFRNAANSLQIEGKEVLPGDPSHGGWEHGTRDHIYPGSDWARGVGSPILQVHTSVAEPDVPDVSSSYKMAG